MPWGPLRRIFCHPKIRRHACLEKHSLPRGDQMTWPINEFQNSTANLKYLAARRKTFQVCNLLVAVSFLFALALSIIAFLLPAANTEMAKILAIVSLIYTVFEAIYIEPKIAMTSTRNAALQEKFDCNIFDLEQNPNFAPDLSLASIEADASGLSNKKMANLKNWYESDLGSLPKPVASVVAQYTSTSYDQALRRFYLKILSALFIVLIVCSLVDMVVENDKFRAAIVVSVVPFVPLVTWFIRTIRSNRELVSDQEKTLRLMDEMWLQICKGVLRGPELLKAARDCQDALYIRRASGTLIFPGIYKLKRSALEGRAARKASTFRAEFERHRSMT